MSLREILHGIVTQDREQVALENEARALRKKLVDKGLDTDPQKAYKDMLRQEIASMKSRLGSEKKQATWRPSVSLKGATSREDVRRIAEGK